MSNEDSPPSALTDEQIIDRLATEVIVDPQDEWLLRDYKWRFHSGTNTTYIRLTMNHDGWRKDVFLHRAIMKPNKWQLVDHKNGNGLDCRRVNLRLCTRAENNRNFRPHGKTSKFKGVSWRSKDKCWVMQIHIPDSKKKRITELFPADQEVNAARRHDYWAKKFHKEFAFLNFPS